MPRFLLYLDAAQGNVNIHVTSLVLHTSITHIEALLVEYGFNPGAVLIPHGIG